MKSCPVPSTSYDICTSKTCYVQQFRRRCIYKKIHYLTFQGFGDLVVKVTGNIAQYPLHHVTNATANFEIAVSNDLGGDAITRRYIIYKDRL